MKKFIAAFLSVTIVVSTFLCFGLNSVSAENARKATLQIEGFENREVLNFDISATKIPGSNPKCNIVKIKVQALKSENTQLLQWALELNNSKTAVIDIVNTAFNSELKKITFKDAECIHYEESYEQTASGAIVHYEEISLMYSEIQNSVVSVKSK